MVEQTGPQAPAEAPATATAADAKPGPSTDQMAKLQMQRLQLIKHVVKNVFVNDAEETQRYGFDNIQVQFYAAEQAEKWVPKIGHVNGFLNPETEEQGLLVFDDAWLKMANIMWTRDRKQGRSKRQAAFTNRQGAEWAVQAMIDVRKRKQVFERAGEVTCCLGSFAQEPILYFRDGEVPTLMDFLDPVQVFIPAPVLSNVNRSKVVVNLLNDKPRTVTILAEALETSLDIMKGFEQELLQAELIADLVQPVQLLALEDILFNQHQIDMEDFKQTVMHHRILEDQMIVKHISDAIRQVQEYFSDKFPDQE